VAERRLCSLTNNTASNYLYRNCIAANATPGSNTSDVGHKPSLGMFKNFRPYDLLGIAGLLLFFISFFIPSLNVDVYFNDRYFVFEMSDAFEIFGGALLALFTVNTFL
jgi:hypothetical protein